MPSSAAATNRHRLYASLAIARKKAGLDEDAYRQAMAARYDGRRSGTELTDRELIDFINHLSGSRRAAKTDPWHRKARALWISLYWLGVVDDRSDKALQAFARRQTGIEAAAWVKDWRAVVEALKAMAMRAGVDWAKDNNPRVCVVFAQLGFLTRDDAKMSSRFIDHALFFMDHHDNKELFSDKVLDNHIRAFGPDVRRFIAQWRARKKCPVSP
ncbi:MAG: regulatory protein GemA [Pseudomonadota bacterium]